MMSRTWRTELNWQRDPELMDWVSRSRLNLLGALPEHLSEEHTRAAVQRYAANIGPAIQRLAGLPGSPSANPA